MNHSHRSLRNAATETVAAVPETTGARGARRSSNRSAARTAFGLTPLALALALAHGASVAATTAAQLPTGGVVRAGNATIATNGSTLTVDQASNRAVIDWHSFNIGAKGTVDFVQPGAGAVTLNRVVGNEGSVIDGALNANGQVFLLNPNGVLFGRHAVVDTGGLLASTLDIANADFMAGKSTFSTTGRRGSIVNDGSLTATGGGYIALVGNRVSNDGVITARLGTVALAAGDAVTLNFSGTSLVDVTIDRPTYDALVENRRIIVADGGLVKLAASTADSLVNTVVNNTGVIQSETVASQGGRIFLLGEGGKVEVGGTLDASAPNGGDGGHIETSGARVSVADGTKITTAAASGTTGTWLVDPTDFTIAASGGDITGATLTSELANNNVTLQSSNGAASGQGNVNVDDAVGWSSHTLTLQASNDIDINAVMTATGTAGLNLDAASNNVNVGLGASGFRGRLDFNSSGVLQMTVGGTLQPFTIIHDASQLQAMQGNLAGNYALGSDVDLSSTTWTPIGINSNKFAGVFDGLGHVVDGLNLTYTASASVIDIGLFGSASGILRNVGLTNATIDITGGSNSVGRIGLLAGQLAGEANNTYAVGSVSVSSSNGNLGVKGAIGGLVGETNAYQSIIGVPCEINNSFANVNVDTSLLGSQFEFVGGLVGNAIGSITNSYATGSVVGWQDVGGLAGAYTANGSVGEMDSTYATGSVTGHTDAIGGLLGVNQGPVSNSYSSGTVYASGTGSYGAVGGLIGSNSGVVTSSFTVSPVVTSWVTDTNGYYNGPSGYVVGAAVGADWGVWDNVAQVERQGAKNIVYGTAVAGSLAAVGFQYDTTVDPLYGFTPNAPTGIGMTTAQMQARASYTSATAASGNVNLGWDFAGTWTMYDGHTLPLLTSFLTPLTISAVIAPTKTYDGSASSGAATYSMSVDPAHLQGSLDVSSASKNVGTYTVTPAGVWSDQQGYLITFASAQTTITPAQITAAASGGTQVYDGTRNAVVTLGGNIVPGDQVVFGDASATMADKNVGTGKAVSVTGITLSGADAGNYVLASTSASTTTNVSAATLAVTATGGTQVYNASTAANVTLSSNAIAGDSVSLSDAAATMADKNVGSNKAVSVTGLALSGADAGNYVLANTTASTTATVTPATLSVTASAANQALASGTNVAVTLAGDAIAGDQVTLHDASATVPDASTGAGKVVTVGGTALSGADAANYTLASTSTTTTVDILPSATGGSTTGAVPPTSLPAVIASAVTTPGTSAPARAVAAGGAIAPTLEIPLAAGGGGAPSTVVYATPGNGSDGTVTLDELRKMMQIGPGQKVVVPVANSKFVSLLNGGVKLPAGVEQQFFVNSNAK